MNRILFFLLLSAALLTIAACDSNGDDDDGGGLPGSNFSAEVSGAFNLSMTGSAGFAVGTNAQTGEQAFQVSMTGTSGSGAGAVISASVFGAGRPGTGTRSFISFDDLSGGTDPAGQLFGTFQFNSQTFLSDGGTMTITDSESNRVQGNFTMTASTFTGPGLPPAQTVTVTGEFDASGVEVTGGAGQ